MKIYPSKTEGFFILVYPDINRAILSNTRPDCIPLQDDRLYYDGHGFWHLFAKLKIMKAYFRLIKQKIKPFHLLFAFYATIIGAGLIYQLTRLS